MDPSEVPGLLDGIANRAEAAASPAVLAMSRTFQRAVKRNLSLRTRPADAFRPKEEKGQFPALRSGQLRRSVRVAGGGGGGPVAVASVAPHMIYAAVQEYGRVIDAHSSNYMHFFSGGEWFLKTVSVGENPYMRPTIRQCIGSGSLGRSAAKAFDVAVWGR